MLTRQRTEPTLPPAATKGRPTSRTHPRLGLALLICLAAVAALTLLSGCALEANAEAQATASINAMRADAGLLALTPDARLTAIARARSEDMAAKGYFGHTPPDGCDYVCLMGQQGVGHTYAGETIAWNTYGWPQAAGAAVRMWAQSAPHRAKMLDCHFTRVGVGVAAGAGGRIYFTAVYEGNARC